MIRQIFLRLRLNVIYTDLRERVTGLQLVKPDMELRYAIDVAIGFEMEEFKNAPDQVILVQKMELCSGILRIIIGYI